MDNATFFVTMAVAIEVILLVATSLIASNSARPIALLTFLVTFTSLVLFVWAAISGDSAQNEELVPFVSINGIVVLAYGSALYVAYRRTRRGKQVAA